MPGRVIQTPAPQREVDGPEAMFSISLPGWKSAPFETPPSGFKTGSA